MLDNTFLACLLDSLKNPILFADTGHVVRYVNRAGRNFYTAADELIGKSLLDCHNPESREVMRGVLERLAAGLDEELIVDSEKHRIYMRAVRDVHDRLIGYYERFDPPRGS
ncbi:MAG: PAS domain-containing protein [Desulfuromonadales bacterium]|nr:PAS domain-containing protein [Desulfuromonadales bacterium]